MKRSLITIGCILFLMTATTAAAQWLFGYAQPVGPTEQKFGFAKLAVVWPKIPGSPTKVSVCWERLDPTDATYRAAVQQSIDDTWSAAAPIDFVNWIECQPHMMGIHIRLSDDGGETKGLGIELDGVVARWQ